MVAGYSVTGTDGALFTISSSGELTFNNSPNFEMLLESIMFII